MSLQASITSAGAAPVPGLPEWIVCQIGAREHYSLAAELQARGLLRALYTDIWTKPGGFLSGVSGILGARGRHLRGRYEPGLREANVLSDKLHDHIFRIGARGHESDDLWATLMAANRRFASRAARRLPVSGLLEPRDGQRPVVFAYSYAALDILRSAKRAGCRTVLGQIDPGPEEDDLVARIAQRHHVGPTSPPPAPSRYWDLWREECDLADAIVVNSNWSAELVGRTGIDRQKIHVVPLIYETKTASGWMKTYPGQFTHERPMQALFLGQFGVRKGAIELLEAISLLRGEPVQLTIVGPTDESIARAFSHLPQVRWIGPVARDQAEKYYKEADVFVLPTHSDGFALTQLEAASYALPLIVTRNCGAVVEDNVNGLVLECAEPVRIAEALRFAASHPARLQTMSNNAASVLDAYSATSVVDRLVGLVGMDSRS